MSFHRMLVVLFGAGTLATPAWPEVLTVQPDGTGDHPTIQAAVDAAADGDVIELGDGVFTGFNNINVSFRGKGITVRSASGDPATCVIQGDGANTAFLLENGEPPEATVQGVWIRGSTSGFHVLESSGSIVGCWLQGNVEGITANLDASIVVRDCLISGNFWGVLMNFATIQVEDCTITANRRGVFANTNAEFFRSVLWGNCDYDIQVGDFTGRRFAPARLTCCVVDSANTIGGVSYLADNVFTNPLFCDPVDCSLAPTNAGEYTVDVLSPCLPQNNACGVLIGALGAGCSGSTPTLETTWGHIKDRFR